MNRLIIVAGLAAAIGCPKIVIGPQPTPAPSATPSASPSPTPDATPSPTPTATPTVEPGPTPSAEPSPTPSPIGNGGRYLGDSTELWKANEQPDGQDPIAQFGDQVNWALTDLTKCDFMTACEIARFGTDREFFAGVLTRLRRLGHDVGIDGDQIVVCGRPDGLCESYHIYNYGGPTVVWFQARGSSAKGSYRGTSWYIGDGTVPEPQPTPTPEATPTSGPAPSPTPGDGSDPADPAAPPPSGCQVLASVEIMTPDSDGKGHLPANANIRVRLVPKGPHPVNQYADFWPFCRQHDISGIDWSVSGMTRPHGGGPGADGYWGARTGPGPTFALSVTITQKSTGKSASNAKHWATK